MKRKTNLLKLGIFLFGIILTLFNCQKEQEIINNNAKNNIKDIKTVSYKDAIKHFDKNNKENKNNANGLVIEPQWETLEQLKLNFTNALLTNVKINANIQLAENTRLFFINVNNNVISAIKTNIIIEKYSDNTIKNGFTFFHSTTGKFLHAYKTVNGKLSYKLVPKPNTQEAFFLAFFFQSDGSSCSGSLTLQEILNLALENGGYYCFDTVVVNGTTSATSSSSPGSPGTSATSSSSSSSNSSSSSSSDAQSGGGGNSSSSSTNSPEELDPDSDAYNQFITDTESECSGGKVPDGNGGCKCPDNKVEDPNGNCIDDPCANNNDLMYNSQTGKCECRDPKKMIINGNCVDDTPCNRIKKELDNPNVLDKIEKLERKVNLKKENGYSQSKNGPFTELRPRDNGHQLEFEVTENIIGYMHTHINKFFTGRYNKNGEPEYSEPYRIFSDTDTFKFLELVKNAQEQNIPIKDVYAILISSYGNFTLRFTGNPNDIDLTLFDDPREKYVYRKKYKKYFGEKYKSNLKQAYLHFLKDEVNINGIELYEIKNDGDDIERITLKPNGKPQSNDCE